MQTGARRHWCVCVRSDDVLLGHLAVPKSVKVHSVLVQGIQLQLEIGHLRHQFKLLRLQRRSAKKFLLAKKMKNKMKKRNLCPVRSSSRYSLCADIPNWFVPHKEDNSPPPPATTNTPAAASPPWRWVSPCARPNTSPGPESSPPEPPPGRSTHSPAKDKVHCLLISMQ